MPSIEGFVLLADYNRWMNDKLYGVCAAIPDTDRKKDLGAFFRSIHGTLNHLLLADRLWMSRFQGQVFVFDRLDQELFGNYAELRAEREKTDRAICAWVRSLGAADLERILSFVAVVTGKNHLFKMADAVLHFFNHQTHHRGQLTTIIAQLGYDFGVTDLMWMPGIERS